MPHPNTIALLATCLVDQLMPEVGVAAVRLLQRAGYAVDFPPGQTCCGQPFYNTGVRPEAAQLAQRTIELFQPYAAVVAPGGSCVAMLRHEYPRLLGDDPVWRERAEALADKTFELSQFLEAEQVDLTPRSAARPTATYHDSCHMCRLLGLRGQPRRLLEQAGYTLVEMREPDLCCGFGGLFSLRMPEISNAMTAVKLQQAVATGADLLVSADPGCLMQMRGLARGRLRVAHLAVALEEATR